ncbi:MAG: methionine gamma-lyase family protein [Clostridia bacterium]|nr:methionine gamma-lyase family protein [Clostridia bacterium]
MFSFFSVDKSVRDASDKALTMCREQFQKIDEIRGYNQIKMLKAFQEARVSESMFGGSSGYGYGDRGRDALDEVYAYAFDAEDALVRHNFVSGTHALTVALFGVLRPGDVMLSVASTPYDTLRGAIGIDSDYSGSLKDFGVIYKEVDLKSDGTLDYEAIEKEIAQKPRMVYIQRSRGYELRPSLLFEDIKRICEITRRVSPESVIMLDNCYGEFVELESPHKCGVDLMAGSMIKNPGGAIARTGGYISGRRDLVEQAAFRLTTPGTGKELGATLDTVREMFLGAYNAPHITGEAMKTAVFSAALFELLGYEVTPRYNEDRGDIIQVLKLSSDTELVEFCRGIQAASPVDSFVVPEPSDMPGYDCQVVMASGAFTLGSSIELSCDAPLRPPFAVWLQGAHNFDAGRLGIMLAAQRVINLK